MHDSIRGLAWLGFTSFMSMSLSHGHLIEQDKIEQNKTRQDKTKQDSLQRCEDDCLCY